MSVESSVFLPSEAEEVVSYVVLNSNDVFSLIVDLYFMALLLRSNFCFRVFPLKYIFTAGGLYGLSHSQEIDNLGHL